MVFPWSLVAFPASQSWSEGLGPTSPASCDPAHPAGCGEPSPIPPRSPGGSQSVLADWHPSRSWLLQNAGSLCLFWGHHQPAALPCPGYAIQCQPALTSGGTGAYLQVRACHYAPSLSSESHDRLLKTLGVLKFPGVGLDKTSIQEKLHFEKSSISLFETRS